MKSCPTCQAAYPTNFAVCPQDGTLLVEAGTWPEGMVVRGKYRILNKIGQGGMGTVYRAVHVAFDELRALKVISPELLGDELFARRFKHEAIITRKLQHPNAVRVDDIDEAEDGRPFIVMEYIEGQSLKKLIQEQGALPAPRVCSLIKQVAAALEAAHRLGMVHRDIKPDNIVLVQTPEGERAKVLDFGIAKIKEGRRGATASMTLTGTGVVIGTPQYMSPEQAMGKRGDQLDGRSDLYSLGVVMYEMLTGALPFQADTTMEMILAHLQRPPTPIRTLRPELQIPEALAALVMRLLEKNPDLRPASGAALIAELEGAETGAAPPAPTWVARPARAYVPGAAQALQAALRTTPAAGSRRVTGSVVPAPAAPAPQPRPVTAAEAPLPSGGVVRPAAARSRPQPWGLWAAGAILVIALGGGAWYFALRHPTPVPEAPAPAWSPSPAPAGGSPGVSTKSPEQGSQPLNQQESANPAAENRPASGAAAESPAPAVGAVPLPSQSTTRAHETRVRREVQPQKPTVDAKQITAAVKMGDFFFDRGEYDSAIAEYQRGLGLDPGNRELSGRIERARRAKAAEERLNQ
jgi:serine/threonine-protein kinase